MSMEQELKRIADSLERIEAVVVAGKPVRLGQQIGEVAKDPAIVGKKRGPKGPKAPVEAPVNEAEDPTVDSGDDAGEDLGFGEEEVKMSAEEFLAYCNEKLSVIKEPAKKKDIITVVKDNILGKYGVKSIKEIPAAKLDEAKMMFDKIMGV